MKEKVKEERVFEIKHRKKGDFTQNKVKDGSGSESKAEPQTTQRHSSRRLCGLA